VIWLPPDIPETFVDDGCSNSPDGLCGTDFRWACRIHDWRYCTRCHPFGTMCWKHRLKTDRELRRNLAVALPWWNQWIRFAYWFAVRRFGSFHAYDTCGPEAGERCRHNMEQPGWMKFDRLKEQV